MNHEFPKYLYHQADKHTKPVIVKDPDEEQTAIDSGFGQYPWSPTPINRDYKPEPDSGPAYTGPQGSEYPRYAYHRIGQNVEPKVVRSHAELLDLGTQWSVLPWSKEDSDAALKEINTPKVEAPVKASESAPLAPPLSPKGKPVQKTGEPSV